MSSDHGEGADPHRSKPTRSQPPQSGAPPGGTRGQEGQEEEAGPPPGEDHGAREPREAPAAGSGTTRPVGRPTTPEEQGEAPPPPAGPAPGTGEGTPAHGGGGQGPGGAPPPPTGPGAMPSSGSGVTPPTGPGASSSSGSGTAPPTGPDAAPSSGSGVTPPPGPGGSSPSGPGAAPPPGSGTGGEHGYGPPLSGGSPYDQPPGSMPPPPPPPPYGGGPGGSPYGAPDPRLAGMPPLGGLGRRLLARIIDALIVYIPVSLFLTLIGRVDEVADTDNTGSQYAWGIFGILVYLVYEGLMLTRSGQTVGKKLMGIRVGMLENGAVPAGGPGWLRAAVYSLPAIVPCIGSLFWLYNVLSCTWDRPYRQCVHDKAAKTVVVSTEGQRYTP
ncbi:RDD family protein [Streptomyces sp. B22F1]|uniref:RDD family protein n=1 Tax=Streptomyces sp. B22F1 TaxID=3153566 RepID=UPI00325C8B71